MSGNGKRLPAGRERFFSRTPGQKSGVILKPKHKYALIKQLEQSGFDVVLLCRLGGVSRSGYYQWLKHSHEPEKDYEDYLLIKRIFDKGRRKWGFRTIQMKLAEEHSTMNHKKIIRIMNKYDLVCTIRRKNPYKAIMRRTAEHRTFENVLDRRFERDAPFTAFCTDITYVPFNRRFAYLSAVKDIASGEIVAWNASPRLGMELVTDTVARFMEHEHISRFAETMIHSDQGFHYTSPVYSSMIRQLNMVQSMSRKGNCIDNAPIESFFGHLKDEVDYQHCQTFEQVYSLIKEYMEYYNHKRKQWGLKKMAPVEYRNHLLNAL